VTTKGKRGDAEKRISRQILLDSSRGNHPASLSWGKRRRSGFKNPPGEGNFAVYQDITSETQSQGLPSSRGRERYRKTEHPHLPEKTEQEIYPREKESDPSKNGLITACGKEGGKWAFLDLLVKRREIYFYGGGE